MKLRPLPLLCSAVLAASIILGVAGCDRHGSPELTLHTKLTKDNIAKIQPGMNRTQVETLIGAPTTAETKDFVVFKKTTATYVEGKDSLEVIYKNDEVEEKHSTVGAQDAGTTSSTTTTTTTGQ